MDLANANRLLRTIPANAKVIDVGGGAAPFPRADYVIDALPYTARGGGSDGNYHEHLDVQPRYTADTWITADLCSHQPWPIADKTFDFATCSHLLEDVRDPIWICHELQRIAKAGYIEVPSRVVEQSKGVENPRHAGFYHHRWLISRKGEGLEFRHKPHVLHSVNQAIVTHLSPAWRVNPKHAIVTLEWSDHFEAQEVLEFSEEAVISELCSFADTARRLPALKVRTPISGLNLLKRRIFYMRLGWGRGA